jgi:hypothetical protein
MCLYGEARKNFTLTRVSVNPQVFNWVYKLSREILLELQCFNIYPDHLPSKLTPWRRVLLEKLTGPKLVKKLPAFCGTRRFITAFTSAGHLSLS